jgi:hypothetical protein
MVRVRKEEFYFFCLLFVSSFVFLLDPGNHADSYEQKGGIPLLSSEKKKVYEKTSRTIISPPIDSMDQKNTTRSFNHRCSGDALFDTEHLCFAADAV